MQTLPHKWGEQRPIYTCAVRGSAKVATPPTYYCKQTTNGNLKRFACNGLLMNLEWQEIKFQKHSYLLDL